MNPQEIILSELVKKGYSRLGNNRSWNITNRKLLFLTDSLAKGSLDLLNFEPYKKQVFDREIALITANSLRLKEQIDKNSLNLIDVFCEDGKRAAHLIKTLGKDVKIKYCPLNANKYLVDLAVKNIKKENLSNVKDFHPAISDGEGYILKDLAMNLKKDKEFKRNLILVMGSALASYDIHEYLFSLKQCISEGDYILMGNGIRTGERLVNLSSYKHKIWDNWFANLMTEIGFSESDIEYDARFGNSRVEMYYVINANHKVSYKGKEIEFNKGDEILVAVLYKYYLEELERFCRMYFSKVDLLKDKDEEYALICCRK